MNVTVYNIIGGDYDKGGSASRGLKEQLKKIGADPSVIRRAMIAAYEAEMNVVIHAAQGRMRISLDDGLLDVEVTDEGPGIKDIELAMKEGYSTAPPAARELGFGAGMGLPNIKKNTDFFTIESQPSKGTRLAFSIKLKTAQTAGIDENSILTIPQKCRSCMYCLRTCPTKAMRIHQGKPFILDYLCIDCTCCIGTCESDALAIAGVSEKMDVCKDSTIVLPSAAIVQFGSEVTASCLIDILKGVGFGQVRLLQSWEDKLRSAVLDYAEHEAKKWPVISPMCPAAVNLIRSRYPSLIENIAPFHPPIYSLAQDIGDKDAIYVAICPSQKTLLASSDMLKNAKIILPSSLRSAVMPILQSSPPKKQTLGGDVKITKTPLQVAGIKHVIKIMDEIEDGQIDDIAAVELYVCDHGCFGSPLLTENPFIAAHRWLKMQYPFSPEAKALRRKEGLTARKGIRLDKDMSKAIEMLKQIQDQLQTLPGRDCGICGAPTCAAMAEDIVVGRAQKKACVFYRD